MCIRDRLDTLEPKSKKEYQLMLIGDLFWILEESKRHSSICLLYTSDAADERSSVDLGGRRIIKKKQEVKQRSDSIFLQHNKI